MHRYIEYISDLLYLHDCVILPGFGGFICNYSSAYVDENSGMICPPGKTILFNRNLTHNDGLLVSWIAAKENLPYDKATAQLSLFCEDLKIRLNQQQRVSFGDIGVFYTDRRFNIIFEDGKHNFFADALGMEPLPAEAAPKTKPAATQATVRTAAPDMSAYIDMASSGNVFLRLLKYGLAAAIITGVVVISQLDIFHFPAGNKITHSTSIQPELSSAKRAADAVTYDSVISPAHDYVDYDPINDLAW